VWHTIKAVLLLLVADIACVMHALHGTVVGVLFPVHCSSTKAGRTTGESPPPPVCGCVLLLCTPVTLACLAYLAAQHAVMLHCHAVLSHCDNTT
jgi:hypothetical protein